MNEPIETEQIFNDIGQKIGLRYRYADGSTERSLSVLYKILPRKIKIKNAVKPTFKLTPLKYQP